MRTLKTTVFLLLLLLPALYAQTPTLNPEQTVNPATGEMGFSLPLATVKGVGGKNVPVNLNYSAAIRCNQQASPAGLGFSYGPGVITRKQIFVPDENTGGPSSYLFWTDENDNIPWWVQALKIAFIVASVIAGLITIAGIFTTLPIAATAAGLAIGLLGYGSVVFYAVAFGPQDYIAGGAHTRSYTAYHYPSDVRHGRGVINGASDDLPDVFFVNSPYISGEMRWMENDPDGGERFVLRSTSGNNISDKETVRIRYKNGSFYFTLADGTRLFFERAMKGKNESRMYVQGGTNTVPYTAWMCQQQREPVAHMWVLTKVLYPDYVDGGEGINADDDPTNSVATNRGMWVVFEYDSVVNANARQLPNCTQAGPCATMVSTSGDYFHELYLRTIKTPNEYAEFSYTCNRKDDLWFPVDSMTWWLDEANDVYNGVRKNNDDGTPSPAVNNDHTATYYCKSKNGGDVAPIERGVLDSLTVYTPDGRKRKTVHFTTGYVLRPSTMHSYTKGTDYSDFDTLSGNGRAACLTLLSLEFESAWGNERKQIEFNYSPKNPAVWDKDVELLPEGPDQYSIRYYRENRDLWGYYSRGSGTGNNFNIRGRYERTKDADGWSLEEVVFPTGLRIRWEYEPNRYDASNGVKGIFGGDLSSMMFGGGIRVKKVTADDGIAEPVSWRYVYTCDEGVFTEKEMPGDTSNISGHATVEPFNYLQTDSAYDYRTDPLRRGGLYTPAKVAYELVQVIKNYHEPDEQYPVGFAPEGFTAYRFLTSLDHRNLSHYGDQDVSWMRGLLKEKSVYNSKGRKIGTQTNDYDFEYSLVAHKGHNRAVADALYEESRKYLMGIVRLKSSGSTVAGVETRKEMYYQTDAYSGKNIVDDTVRRVDTLVPATKVPLHEFDDAISGGCVMVKELGSDPDKDDMILVLNYHTTSDIYLQLITDMEFANGTGSCTTPGTNWYHDNTDNPLSTVLGVGYADVVNGSAKDLVVLGERNDGSGGTILHPLYCSDGIFGHLYSGRNSTSGQFGTTKMTTAVLHDFDSSGVPDVLLYSGGGTTPAPTLLYVIVNPDFTAGSYDVYTSDPTTPFLITSRYATVGDFDGNDTIDLMCAGPDVTDTLQGRKPLTRSIIYNITLDAATKRVVTGNHGELTEPAFVVENNLTRNERFPEIWSSLFFGFGLTDDNNPVFAFSAYMSGKYPLYLAHSYDHVVYRDYDGQPDQVVEYFTGDSMRITVPKAAYIDNADMGDPSVADHRHMLSQTSDNTVYRIAPSTTLPIDPTAHYATAVSARASRWNCADGWCYPFAGYGWNMPMTSGVPDSPLSSFVHTAGAANPDWDLTDSICSYGRLGLVQETAQPTSTGGRLKSSAIYGYNGTLPVASVTRAAFQECGVFTGDYQCTADPTSWWDKDNGWEKGQTNPPTLDGDSIHFGEKSIRAEDDYAAGRNFLIEPGRAYTMSAWVKLVSGTIRMAADFRYLNAGSAGKWPLDCRTDLTVVGTPAAVGTTLTADGTNDWKLMTLEIPATVTDSLVDSIAWYCRAWIGGNPSTADFTAYIDDIRFAPSDAMVSSTYYDQLWQQPVVSVDANNHPGHKVTYDMFGRPVLWQQIDAARDYNDADYAMPIQSREYGLMYDGLVIESPENGDEYVVEGSMEITWLNYKGRVVDIYYSDTTGENWTFLQRVTPVTGQNSYSHTWSAIPAALNDGDGYRIKVVDVNDTKVLDISGAFAIRKAKVIRPAADDIFQPGSAEEIRYYVYGDTSVQVTIAVDGVDLDTVSNTGSWVWKVPPDFNNDTSVYNAVIEVRGDNGLSAQSDPFIIRRHHFIRRNVYKLLKEND